MKACVRTLGHYQQMIRWTTLVCAASGACFAQDAFVARSAYESAAAKAASSLTASTKDAPRDLLTTGEKTEWNETGLYPEVMELAHRFERASRFVKVLEFGTTPEGRAMIAIVVSKDRAFTPEAAARTNKVLIMIQSGIHSAEIEGKDTVLMLVRDVTITKRFAGWLDHAIFLIIPVFNVDGHEYPTPYHRVNQNGPKSAGLRPNAQRLGLQGDYIKADTPEVRAWLRLFNAWMPDFLIDNHVSDGADFQYDTVWDMPRNQDLADPAGAWVRERFMPEFERRTEADGHLQSQFGQLRPVAGGKLEMFQPLYPPGYSWVYAPVQNRPGMLAEIHSLKSGKTRAWADYDLMRNSIETILLDPEALRAAVRDADRELASRAGDRSAAPVYLNGKVSDKSRPFVYRGLKTELFKSEITGAMVTRYLPEQDDFNTRIHDQIDTTAEAKMPLGYLIPVAWKVLADTLALHGVEVERTAKPIEQEFETYRLSGIKFATGSLDGRVMVDFDVALTREKAAIPPGSYWVPMKQRRARLIMSMLEPRSPESLVRWGCCNGIFERGLGGGEYVLEPIAREMMARSPELRREFEERLAADAQFAANPQARLIWWFQRSKYNDGDMGKYPVMRVWEKTW